MPNFNVLNRLDEGFAQFNALNRLRVLPLFNALNDCGFSEGFAWRRGLPKRYKSTRYGLYTLYHNPWMMMITFGLRFHANFAYKSRASVTSSLVKRKIKW